MVCISTCGRWWWCLLFANSIMRTSSGNSPFRQEAVVDLHKPPNRAASSQVFRRTTTTPKRLSSWNWAEYPSYPIHQIRYSPINGTVVLNRSISSAFQMVSITNCWTNPMDSIHTASTIPFGSDWVKWILKTNPWLFPPYFILSSPLTGGLDATFRCLDVQIADA